MSSVSSVSVWSASPDWVRTGLASIGALLLPSVVTFLCLFSAAVVENQASPSDHHEAAPSLGPTGGEDLHRQVRRSCVLIHVYKRIIPSKCICRYPAAKYLLQSWICVKNSCLGFALLKLNVCVMSGRDKMM